MNAEIRELLNKARRGKQLLSGFWLLVKFSDLLLGKQETDVSEQKRIKQISKWLKEKGFSLRKVRNTGYYSISKLK